MSANRQNARRRAASGSRPGGSGTSRARAGGSRPRGPRPPLPQGQSLYTPGASRARQAMERRSAAPLVFLYGLPRWVPPLVVAALLIAGLAVRNVFGAVALLALAAVLAWLSAVSWPRLSPSGRLTRVGAVAVVIVVAVVQILR